MIDELHAVMVTLWEHQPDSDGPLDERVVTCISIRIDEVMKIWENKTAYGLDILFVHKNEQHQRPKVICWVRSS